MIKQTIAFVSFSIVASLGLSTPAHADIIANVGSYDSPDGYDFVSAMPPTTYQPIGSFTFTLPAGISATGVMISGSFGNGDVPNTSLSDYYLGFGGDEEAVPVAFCDDPLADCYSGQEGPYNWSATLTAPEISELAPAIAAGAVDFGYTWGNSPANGFDQYIYAGAATLDITPSPEPATVLLWFSGLAGIAAFRRFRKL